MTQHLHLVLGLVVAASLLACGESKPVRVVPLKVDSAGEYSLDGRKVELSELKHALRELRTSPNIVQLHIYTAPDTKYEAVGRAIVAAQEAGIAQVSFVTTPPK
jgi:biopolymer transport protein ExbD